MQRNIRLTELLSLLTTASLTCSLLPVSSLKGLEECLQVFSSAHHILHRSCLSVISSGLAPKLFRLPCTFHNITVPVNQIVKR